LQYNDTAANVQAALTGLTSIGAGNVFVTRAHFAEEQVVTVLGAVGGSFTLTFNGQTTTALLFNDTAANVQSALNALSSIGGVSGSVTVTQAGTVYTITFGGSLALQNQALITGTGIGGATATVAPVRDGTRGSEIQTLNISGSGTFKL